MERGIIRAEVFAYQDLMACKTVAGLREKGLFPLTSNHEPLTPSSFV